MIIATFLELSVWGALLTFVLRSINKSREKKKIVFDHPMWFGTYISLALSFVSLICYNVDYNFKPIKHYLIYAALAFLMGIVLKLLSRLTEK